jgi:hypothetical protein
MSLPMSAQWSMITVDGRCFQRLPVQTRWLEETDDLPSVLLEHTGDRRPGDTVAISEKVAVLLTGRSLVVDPSDVRWDARLLARFVRTHHNTFGLSTPTKMEWVLRTVGRPRIFAAAAAAAVTRLFGVRGTFYQIAGPPARDIDGGIPPYEDRLFPPLDAETATQICNELEAKLETGVAIVDINDFGGTVRAVSSGALSLDIVAGALADNPLRQRVTGTPFALIRPI